MWLEIFIISFFVLFGLQWVIILTVSSWTPAFKMIFAKLKKRPMIFVLGRDRKAHLVSANTKNQEVIEYQSGEYIIEPDSMYIMDKGGLPVGVVHSDIGITLNPAIIKALNNLENNKVENLEELENELNRPDYIKQKKAEIEELNDVLSILKNKKKEDLTEEDKDLIPQITKRVKNLNTVVAEIEKIKPRTELLRFSHLLNYFKYNINPSFMKVRIERRIAEELEKERNVLGSLAHNMTWIVPLIMVVGIVSYLLMMQCPPCNCAAAAPPVNAIQNAAGGLIG